MTRRNGSEDTLSTWSAWSGQRCTAVPLDDRAVTTGQHWTCASGGAYWNSPVRRARRTPLPCRGRPLRWTGSRSWATRCGSCGRIKVYVGSSLIGTVNLTVTHTTQRVMTVLSGLSLRSGTVKIDGLGISRP